jgi:hypothetical protein
MEKQRLLFGKARPCRPFFNTHVFPNDCRLTVEAAMADLKVIDSTATCRIKAR